MLKNIKKKHLKGRQALTAAIFLIAAVLVSLSIFALLQKGFVVSSTLSSDRRELSRTGGWGIFKYDSNDQIINSVSGQEEKETNDECADCKRRAIDGVKVENEEDPFPVAVMIENHPDARPQSGISKANLVFEAEAEGGITRFLAVFADGQKLDAIGPIRSARPYFIDWAKEFYSLYVHCGGSPAALAKITKDKIFNLNEFYRSGYFWRSRRAAPHNVYTSTASMEKYMQARGAEAKSFRMWQYKEEAAEEERPEEQEISINFIFPGFKVKWIYDRQKNDYLRYAGGVAHQAADGSEVRAKNIAIAYISARVLDSELRLEMDHIGEGKAVVCRDGACEEGKWEKKTETDRMLFYDSAGEEFQFNGGTTWIEVVKPEIEVLVN